MTIEQAFRETLDEMGLAPFEATKGPCRTVAERVDEKVERDLRVLCSADVTERTSQWHEWIYDPSTGRHHDAEAPRGVEQWQNLPFFGGWRAETGGPLAEREDRTSHPVSEGRQARTEEPRHRPEREEGGGRPPL